MSKSRLMTFVLYTQASKDKFIVPCFVVFPSILFLFLAFLRKRNSVWILLKGWNPQTQVLCVKAGLTMVPSLWARGRNTKILCFATMSSHEWSVLWLSQGNSNVPPIALQCTLLFVNRRKMDHGMFYWHLSKGKALFCGGGSHCRNSYVYARKFSVENYIEETVRPR